MRYWYRMYLANLKIAVATQLQYRFEILIWALWGFVAPLISLAVWNATALSKGGSISNGAVTFSRGDFAAYFLVFMICSHLMMSWDAFEYSFRVREGNLSPRLLKPVHPIHSDASQNIAFKLVTTAMLLPIWVVMFWVLKPTPPAHWWQPVLAIPALLIGAVTRYLWNYSVALIAFWTTRTEAVNQFYFTLDSFLSGRIAPLLLLPLWLQKLTAFTPFRSMGSFPVEVALGRIPPDQVLSGFALQIFWLVAGVVVLKIMWANGIKQYSAVGA